MNNRWQHNSSSPVVLDAQLLHQLEVLRVLVVHVTRHVTRVVIFDEAGVREGVPHAGRAAPKVPATLNLRRQKGMQQQPTFRHSLRLPAAAASKQGVSSRPQPEAAKRHAAAANRQLPSGFVQSSSFRAGSFQPPSTCRRRRAAAQTVGCYPGFSAAAELPAGLYLRLQWQAAAQTVSHKAGFARSSS
eukprot:GHRQ01029211.1.p1 GENE.GHRQ01029211.1~~GHRQ01029211.1.p1  ORF type:complete len:188 (+),score=41.98 GHRQ01029211.1:532-1095(+)